MEPDGWIAFLAVAITVAVVPGPDMALVARNVLLRGRAAGVATSFGVTAGIAAWGFASAVGVTALLAASATAFTVLKLAGAVYLIWLGVTTLRRPRVGTTVVGVDAAADAASAPMRAGTAFASGLVSALLNPKLGVFFLALLPQFADAAAGPTGIITLAGVFAAIGLGWLLAWTLLVAAADAWIGGPVMERWIRRLTGGALVALGVRLAVDAS